MASNTRTFTIAELRALDLPPDSPDQPEYFPDHILADEHVMVLKYTQQRRVIFEAEDDGQTYAVEYEAPLDMGDFEVGDGGPDDYGWYGSVEAVAVEQRQVTVTKWVPVEAGA